MVLVDFIYLDFFILSSELVVSIMRCFHIPFSLCPSISAGILVTVLPIFDSFDSLPIGLYRLFGEYPESDWLPVIAYGLAAGLTLWFLYDLWDTYEDMKDPEKHKKRKIKNERYTKYRIFGLKFERVNEDGTTVQCEWLPHECIRGDRPGW